MHLAAIITGEHLSSRQIWGGDKKKEMLCVRRDFDHNIARPLGPTCFCRSYGMKKDTFYKLYSILKKDLAKEFF